MAEVHDLREDLKDMNIMDYYFGSNTEKAKIKDIKARNSNNKLYRWIANLFSNTNKRDGSSATTVANNNMAQPFTLNSDGSVDLNTLDTYGLDGLIEQVAGYFQASDPRINYAWSAQEAQKERDWQTQMSNTAFQRSVADMKSAGINPIVAYSQGGASSGSGASASSTPTNSGTSLGFLMSGLSSVIKTLMKEDRKDDADAMNLALKFNNKSSARDTSSYYDRLSKHFKNYNSKQIPQSINRSIRKR